jgi:hypothetical protein
MKITFWNLVTFAPESFQARQNRSETQKKKGHERTTDIEPHQRLLPEDSQSA